MKIYLKAYAFIINYVYAIIVCVDYLFPINHRPRSWRNWSPDARLHETNRSFLLFPPHFHIFALHHIATSIHIKHGITTIRCASLSLHCPLVNSVHSNCESMGIFVHSVSVVCFDGSGTKIPIHYHVFSARWAVASGGVGRWCHILMFVIHKPAGFGGQTVEIGVHRDVWVKTPDSGE